MSSNIWKYFYSPSHALKRLKERSQGYLAYLTKPRRLFSKRWAEREVEALLAEPNVKKVKEFCLAQEDYGQDQQSYLKYTDLKRYLNMNLRRVHELGLHRSQPLDILDLGSGAGFFLAACGRFGHTAMGLDLPEPKFYGQMVTLFGAQRVESPIQPMVPLPSLGRKFDLMTAFAVCFHQCHDPERRKEPWGRAEWKFFLEDVFEHCLKPGGRLHFRFHDNPKGDFKIALDHLRSLAKVRTEFGNIVWIDGLR